MHQRERTGGAFWGNSLGRALMGGSGPENAELLARALHRGSFTRRSAQGGLYTQNLLHRETFTQERFYT